MLIKCLNYEIKRKQRCFKQLQEQYKRELSEFKGHVAWLLFKVLTDKINMINEYTINSIKVAHKKKHRILGAEPQSGVDVDYDILKLF